MHCARLSATTCGHNPLLVLFLSNETEDVRQRWCISLRPHRRESVRTVQIVCRPHCQMLSCLHGRTENHTLDAFLGSLFSSGVCDGVRFARALEAHPYMHSRTPFLLDEWLTLVSRFATLSLKLSNSLHAMVRVEDRAVVGAPWLANIGKINRQTRSVLSTSRTSGFS